MDVCADSDGITVSRGIKPIEEAYLAIKKRGIKLRMITEVTGENLPYCKEAMLFVELRHLDGLKGNFAVSDSEYLTTSTLQRLQPVTETTYSNVVELVNQQQFVFDTLWSRAVPAELKIKELENKIGALSEILNKVYLCTKCMTPFLFAEDVKEHEEKTGHSQIKIVPFGSIKT